MAISGTYNLVANPTWKNLVLQEIYLECDTTLAPVTINLFPIFDLGRFWNVKIYVTDISNNAGTNPITINAGSSGLPLVSDTINRQGLTNFTINYNGGDAVLMIVTGNKWSAFSQTILAQTGLTYKGAWDANSNTPTLTSGVGTGGDYYIVSIAGNTNLNGIIDWQVGDWAIFESATNMWQKIDNHDVQAYNTIQEEGVSLPQRSIIDFQGSGVTASDNGAKTIVTVPIQPAYSTIQEEGSSLTQQPIIDFQGAGVTATNGSGKTIVTVPIQPAYSTIQEEGSSLTQQPIIDFQGAGVTATNGSGKTIVTIPSITSDYARGNTLTVDAVYGNDTNATANPNSVPFLTITSALASAVSGNNVVVNAGIYNESIVIPSGVCVTGASSQAVIIRKLGVIANTTLVTMNTNSRLENVTCNLSSSGNFNLTGVEFATGASINAKIRTSVFNITSTTVNAPTIIGALSSGVSATGFSSTDAIARTTINITSSSTGISRGVYVDGANRFTIRESVIFATGTGSNIVGFECNNALSVVAIRTSTVDGLLYDVNRTLGTMLIGGTDLVNNTANGNSFTATQAPASFSFGTINGLGTNRRYYMLTGTIPVGQLTNEAKTNPYDPLLALPVPVTQLSLVIAVTMAYQPALPVATSITLNIYKNLSLTPEITVTMLPADGGIKRLESQSFSLATTDLIRVTLETTGNVGAGGSFQSVIGYY